MKSYVQDCGFADCVAKTKIMQHVIECIASKLDMQ